MLAPLSWLKDYVDIKLSPEQLAERLTEVGLGCEKITKSDGDIIFELEITPNRPDLLSIVGIAREIAAIENGKVNLKKYELKTPQKTLLPMKLNIDYKLFYRWTAVSITDIKVGQSPQWIKTRLKKIGLRPINNIVDITNYVMFELGVPLHAFDYDQIKGKVMTVEEARGGEKFTTVDQKTYSLPKGAIIIKDSERIIDLAGIKGGLNSGITDKTRNIFLHVTIDNPVLIRRASQNLSLRSDASAIYERGTDKGGSLDALKRAATLIIELAGGEVASDIIDLKKQGFKPWTVKLSHQRLTQILGITISPQQMKALLERLNLKITINSQLSTFNYHVIIPTYRNDLRIEEDIIEEVARLYGYNNFPKTLPTGEIPTQVVPYFKDYKIEEKAKQILTAAGFTELYTYSLVSEEDLSTIGIRPQQVLRVDNPVSREYEYLRRTLKINLSKATGQNKPNFSNINLFELGKVYLGKNLDNAQEVYYLSGISNNKSFYEVKGILLFLFQELGVKEDPTEYIEAINEEIIFELNWTEIEKQASFRKTYKPIPKYPPIIEDLALTTDPDVKIGKVIEEIKKQNPLITNVSLLDIFGDTRTFHIVYQHGQRNLTTSEVGEIRVQILKALKKKFNIKAKE